MLNRLLRPVRSTLLALLFVVAGTSGLFAQTNTTTLSGTVTDATGAYVAAVTVNIKNPSTGESKTTTTKSKGEFDFEQLSPGTYEVHVIAKGFSEEVESVELLVATPVKLTFKLTVGTSEVVEVSTGIEALNTTDASLGKAFNSKQVETLPFLANNITYLLSLQPGVLALDPGANGTNTDARTGTINGARQDQTNLTLDGVDNNDPNNGYAFTGILRSTRDSVQEFRVTTTNANADAGRSSGGQVSVSTRSGTNFLHGSTYFFERSGAGAANDWFNKQAELNSGKPNIPPKVLIDTYGASLGGPLVKNKLFAFGAYETYAFSSSAVVSNTVPSVLSQAAGETETPVSIGGTNVYGLVTGDVAYPTATGSVVTLTPAQIASIDPGCTACPAGPGTDAAAIAYFKQFPAANSTAGGDGYNTGIYTFTSPRPIRQYTYVSRLDYNFNSRQSVFFRGTLQQDNTLSTLQFPGQPANTNAHGNNKGLAAGHVWSVTPSLTNNLRYGFTRQGNASRGSGAHPYVSFSGVTSLNATNTDSIIFLVTNNFVDDATFVKGRHTIQFGVNDRLITNNRYANSTLFPNGSISAGPLSTATVAGSNGNLDPALLGAAYVPASSFRSSYNSAILDNAGAITGTSSYTNYAITGNTLTPVAAGTVPNHIFKAFEQEYYVSDQWKATARLTITAGLRYVYLGTPYEINGQQVSPDIDLGTTFFQARQAAAAAGSAYTTRFTVSPSGQANGKPNFYQPQKYNFAPRFAFAYATPNNRTSIRGGFALAYDHFGEALINTYDTGGALALNYKNAGSYPSVAIAPRFTSYTSVPAAPVTAAAQTFPITTPDQTFSNFGASYSFGDINSRQKTPYAETFNLTVQHEVVRGMTFTASYVGRLGRHLLNNSDVATPTNNYDSASGLTYFQAVDAYDASIYAGVLPSSIPQSGFFQNYFPKATYTIKAGLPGAGSYTGAQAYYAYLLNTNDAKTGNETDALYYYDVSPSAGKTFSTANPNGNYKFFNPQYTSLYIDSTIGVSNYHALQLSVRHAFKYGNEYDLNYTYSKSMDEGSTPERSGGGSLINSFNPGQSYADSDFDVRHNITANYSLSMPIGKGQPFFNSNGWVDRIIGGFKLSGTVHYSTAFPFSVSASGAYGTDFDISSYGVQIAPLKTGGHRYVPMPGVNSLETALPSSVQPIGTVSIQAQGAASFRPAFAGQAGQRNEMRADGYFSMDDGFSKSFRIWRETQFRLSAEVFNVLNDVRFGAPNSSLSSTTKFGNYTSTLVTARQMQFSGKFTF